MCVCVSVTLRYCIKTAKRRITQTTPHDSPMTLVFVDSIRQVHCTIQCNLRAHSELWFRSAFKFQRKQIDKNEIVDSSHLELCRHCRVGRRELASLYSLILACSQPFKLDRAMSAWDVNNANCQSTNRRPNMLRQSVAYCSFDTFKYRNALRRADAYRHAMLKRANW